MDTYFYHDWLLTKPSARGGNGVVASHSKAAAEAGAAVLADGGNAIDAAVATSFAVSVVEPWMSGIDGLGELKRRDPGVLVVIMTAFSSWRAAVEAMRLGAFDYLRKPFDNNAVRAVVSRALTAQELAAGGESAETIWGKVSGMIGHGPAMQQVFAVVRRVAPGGVGGSGL